MGLSTASAVVKDSRGSGCLNFNIQRKMLHSGWFAIDDIVVNARVSGVYLYTVWHLNSSMLFHRCSCGLLMNYHRTFARFGKRLILSATFGLNCNHFLQLDHYEHRMVQYAFYIIFFVYTVLLWPTFFGTVNNYANVGLVEWVSVVGDLCITQHLAKIIMSEVHFLSPAHFTDDKWTKYVFRSLQLT